MSHRGHVNRRVPGSNYPAGSTIGLTRARTGSDKSLHYQSDTRVVDEQGTTLVCKLRCRHWLRPNERFGTLFKHSTFMEVMAVLSAVSFG